MAAKSGRTGLNRAAAFAVCGLGLLVSGCAYSLSEFAREPAPPATTASVAPVEAAPDATGAAVPLQPAALVDEGPMAPPIQQSAPQTLATGTLPPLPPAPPSSQPDSKLLTPEEKARVIAELEALAKSQKVAPPGPVAPQTKCEDETLDPAERLRREEEGIEC